MLRPFVSLPITKCHCCVNTRVITARKGKNIQVPNGKHLTLLHITPNSIYAIAYRLFILYLDFALAGSPIQILKSET